MAAGPLCGAPRPEWARASRIAAPIHAQPLDRFHVRELCRPPATHRLFIDAEHDLMQELFYRALHAVEEGLGARREYLRKDGTTLEGGPDHYARLTATKHLRDFMSLGRPKPKWEPKKRQGMMTYEELCAITDGRMPADENE